VKSRLEALKSKPAIISSEDALTKLVHPDFVKMGAEETRLNPESA